MYSVLIVDDSPVMRKILKDMINRIDDFQVIETANDAYEAREKIKQYEPDLITLDINMPKMDGVVFLKNLMRLHPMPTVVISSESARGSEVFDDGAIGFVEKQTEGENTEGFFNRLKETLNSLSFMFERYKNKKEKTKQIKTTTLMDNVERKVHPDEFIQKTTPKYTKHRIIAIGSSTGGVESLLEVFKSLPSNLPPIVITQHIPYGFSKSFANRLDSESDIKVVEASGGERLEYGHAYLAPGNMHLTIEQHYDDFYVKLLDGTKVSRHKPSVDVMFRSVHNNFGKNAMGIIMTGMGDDGSIGMKDMYDAGAYTIAQSERTCVVYGMPKKAEENGGVVKADVDLQDIARYIVQYANR